MTPIPISSRVWIGSSWRGLPCSRSYCTRRRPFPPWRWVGWRWPSCSRFRFGPSRTSCQGAGDPADRCGHARLDLSWFLLPRAAPDRAVEHLVRTTPRIANSANQLLLDVINALNERQLVPGSDPEEFGRRLVTDLFDRAQNLTENLLRSLLGFIPRAFNFGVTLFGIIFVAIYLLVDVRKVKAALLKSVPAHYRHDARDLWEAFGDSPRATSGGCFRGHDPGRPGRWRTISPRRALRHPSRRVGLGHGDHPLPRRLPGGYTRCHSGPRLRVSNFESSTTTAILTIVAYVLIQQLEGNFLTPRIQGQALHMHPILVLLAVIAGGELAGLAGVVFAVPALAVFRVLFDFFKVRLRRK